MAKRAKPLGPRTPQQEHQSRGTDFLGSAHRVGDILAINLPPDVRQRTRFSKAGKMQKRYTLEIETEPIFHALEEPELGRRAAEVIAEQAGANLRNAGRKAAAATQKWRKAALRRLRSGATEGGYDTKKKYGTAGSGSFGSLLKKRYSGGRIGHIEPQEPHDQYGVDSGRLADNMFARLNRSGRTTTSSSLGHTRKGQRSEWIINVPANRLNREQWQGDQGAFMEWLKEFRDIVNLSGIVSSGEFQNALAEGLERVIGKLGAAQWKKRRALLRQQWKVVAGGARLLAVI
jgi:hypothetical protein